MALDRRMRRRPGRGQLVRQIRYDDSQRRAVAWPDHPIDELQVARVDLLVLSGDRKQLVPGIPGGRADGRPDRVGDRARARGGRGRRAVGGRDHDAHGLERDAELLRGDGAEDRQAAGEVDDASDDRERAVRLEPAGRRRRLHRIAPHAGRHADALA